MARSSMWNRLSRIQPDWPLSSRLTLWYGGTMLALLALFAVFCYTTFHAGLHHDFDRHLAINRSELIAGGDGQAASGLPDLTDELTSGTYQAEGVYGTYVRLLAPNGTVLTRSPNFQAHSQLPVRLPARVDPREQETSPMPTVRISRTWEDKPARRTDPPGGDLQRSD